MQIVGPNSPVVIDNEEKTDEQFSLLSRIAALAVIIAG